MATVYISVKPILQYIILYRIPLVLSFALDGLYIRGATYCALAVTFYFFKYEKLYDMENEP